MISPCNWRYVCGLLQDVRTKTHSRSVDRYRSMWSLPDTQMSLSFTLNLLPDHPVIHSIYLIVVLVWSQSSAATYSFRFWWSLIPTQMNTLRPRTKWPPFSYAFYLINIYWFQLIFHWNLFRYRLGDDQTTSHYLYQWCLLYWHICASFGLNELTSKVVSLLKLGKWRIITPHCLHGCNYLFMHSFRYRFNTLNPAFL